jgi:hypothetical protein
MLESAVSSGIRHNSFLACINGLGTPRIRFMKQEPLLLQVNAARVIRRDVPADPLSLGRLRCPPQGQRCRSMQGPSAASPFVLCLFPVLPRDLREAPWCDGVLWAFDTSPCAGPRVLYIRQGIVLLRKIVQSCGLVHTPFCPYTLIPLHTTFTLNTAGQLSIIHVKLQGRVHRDGSLRGDQHQNLQAERDRSPQHTRYQR